MTNDETTAARVTSLEVRCKECEKWLTAHIEYGRLKDFDETTCPHCGGKAFTIALDGTINGEPLKPLYG